MAGKKSRRIFYRNVFVVEVLSEDPLVACPSLEQIDRFITDGDGSGQVVHQVENQKVGGPRMAAMLEKQGSDPGFFDLTSDGDDTDKEVEP